MCVREQGNLLGLEKGNIVCRSFMCICIYIQYFININDCRCLSCCEIDPLCILSRILTCLSCQESSPFSVLPKPKSFSVIPEENALLLCIHPFGAGVLYYYYYFISRNAHKSYVLFQEGG